MYYEHKGKSALNRAQKADAKAHAKIDQKWDKFKDAPTVGGIDTRRERQAEHDSAKADYDGLSIATSSSLAHTRFHIHPLSWLLSAVSPPASASLL